MRLKNYLSRSRQWGISLVYYDENLACLDNIKETIGLQIRNSRADAHASKDLKSFRDEMERRILYALSAMIADYAEILEQDICTIEKLNYIFLTRREQEIPHLYRWWDEYKL